VKRNDPLLTLEGGFNAGVSSSPPPRRGYRHNAARCYSVAFLNHNFIAALWAMFTTALRSSLSFFPAMTRTSAAGNVAGFPHRVVWTLELARRKKPSPRDQGMGSLEASTPALKGEAPSCNLSDVWRESPWALVFRCIQRGRYDPQSRLTS